ncbi:PQQ-binding-like beta-propeller repeat protein [Dactylosporangium siamense]|nr:PQQ-binding-like beta-propeller repeat protein [Dactylosporangium siamense]
MRRRFWLLVVAGLLAGCDGGGTPSAAKSPAPPPLAQAWTRTDLKPIGQLTAVAGVAVGYVADSGRLQLLALDPATGKTLWQRAASPGEVVTGIAVTVTVVDGKVVYFRADPKGNLFASMVVADPRSGEDLAVTAPALFVSPPAECSNKTDVCTISRTSYKDRAVPHRLRMTDKQYVEENTGEPAGARSIGAGGLTDLGTRKPETLAVVRDGKVVWKRPLAEAFPAGFSTDHGWNWQLYSQQKLYIGSVYGDSTGTRDTTLTRDLATGSATAALSETDGAVVWRDSGSSLHCSSLLDLPVNPDDADGPAVAVRCRSKGTSTWSAATKKSTRTGLDVVIEGFDVMTGKTTWSVPVGAADELAGGDQRPAVAGPARVLITGGTGPVVIDLISGKAEKPAADATFWCGASSEFTYDEPYYFDGKPETKRRGGTLGVACGIDGKPVDRQPGDASARAFGTRIGSDILVAKAGAVTGYHQG